MKNWILFSLLTLGLGLMTSCGGRNAEETNVTTGGNKIILANENWATSNVLTYLTKAILEEEGYEVQVKNFSIEKIFVEMKQGDVDVFMDVWYDAHSIYLYEFGEVEDYGAVYEGCQLGWAVPSYSKFVNIGDLTSDPESFGGTIFGIRKDAGVMLATKAVIQENGWSFEVKNLETQELSKQLQASKSQGKEFVTAAWTPDWKNAEYDLRFLKDTSGLFGKSDEIRKMGREGFAATFPEAHKIIEAIYIEDEQFSDFLNLMRDVRNPEKVEAIAKEWVANNRSIVDEWLAIAKKEEATL